MARSIFVYVSYIRTTPERLWSALTDDIEFMKQYWFAGHCESEWTVGSTWKLVSTDGEVMDQGEIVEVAPPRRLVIRYRHVLRDEFKSEDDVLCTIELEPRGAAVKLTVTHVMEREGSKFIAGVSLGWPVVVSNLKSLIESGAIAVVDPLPWA